MYRLRFVGLALLVILAACSSNAPVTRGSHSSTGSGTGLTGAGSATLSWVAPTTMTTGAPLSNLAGYHIYYGMSSTVLDHVLRVADPAVTSAVIEKLSSGTWYFATTAVDASGLESSFSNIAQKTIS